MHILRKVDDYCDREILLCNIFFGKLFINVIIERLYGIVNTEGLYLCYDHKQGSFHRKNKFARCWPPSNVKVTCQFSFYQDLYANFVLFFKHDYALVIRSTSLSRGLNGFTCLNFVFFFFFSNCQR